MELLSRREELNTSVINSNSRRRLTAVAVLGVIFVSCASHDPATERSATPHDDSPIGRAFASGTSHVQVEGEGTVIRVLPDDVDGSRHQRFIVQLASGQTLLITYNIDVAPRIAGLKVGDSVGFNGEYVWNEKGGIIHWTHHDPQRGCRLSIGEKNTRFNRSVVSMTVRFVLFVW